MGVLVGKKAPGFSAQAVINGGQIVDNFNALNIAKTYVLTNLWPRATC